MNIIYYGLNCFKLQGKEVSLITDLFDPKIGLKYPNNMEADIVTISKHQDDYNNTAVLKNDPFVVDGVGEYEIKKVFIRGIESEGGNVIYKILMDNIKICHLGALSQTSLTSGQLDLIGDIDILFIPIGGHSVLDMKAVEGVVMQIEPNIVIPMHFKLNSISLDLADSSVFCQTYAVNAQEAVSKLNIKEKDVASDDTRFILMDLGK